MQSKSLLWPEPSAHRLYWERYNCSHVYEYDPTDDGPETEIARAVGANYTFHDLADERLDTLVVCCLDTVILSLEVELASRRLRRKLEAA